MTIADGAYLVINAASLLALDVNGAADASGANVQVWTVNRTDAQIWYLSTIDGKTALRCSLTGRTLDVEKGVMADGTNVRQWTDNGTDAQRWVLSEDGTAVYGGATHTAFTVGSAADASYLLDAAGSAVGSNVRIMSGAVADSRRWVLVPVPALTEGGTYSIVSELDPGLVLDIPGASTASYAGVQTYTYNGTGAQVFAALLDAATGLVKLVNAASGKLLDSGSATYDGQRVYQNVDGGWDAQRWLPVVAGSMRLNGQVVPTYEIRALSGSGRCMDVAGGSTTIRTRVQMWRSNGTAAQRFAFRKDEVERDALATPNPVGASGAAGVYATDTVVSSGTVYPCWHGSVGRYRCRYMLTTRPAVGASSSTPWRSLKDGGEANEGWGDAWTSMVDDPSAEVVSPHGIAVETSPIVDAVELRLQVRSYSDDVDGFRAHSPSADGTIMVCHTPVLTLSEVALVPDSGIVVAFSSDSPRTGCTARVRLLSAGRAVSDAVTRTGLGQVASVTIPFDALHWLPDDGEEVTVAVEWATPYITASAELHGPISYQSGHGTALSPSTTDEADTRCRLYSAPSADSPRCWLLVERGHGIDFEEMPGFASGDDTVFRVPYLLNARTRVFMVSRRSETEWASWSESYTVESSEYVWNWGEHLDEVAVLRLNVGSAPGGTRGYSADAEVSATTGREHPVAHGGSTVAVDLGVSGVLFGQVAGVHETAERMDALAHALADGHCPVYRNPRGDWYRVAVTGVDVSWDSSAYDSVSVSQQAVSV